eukprot:161656-Chlamydomonas_euryale.AAC.5
MRIARANCGRCRAVGPGPYFVRVCVRVNRQLCVDEHGRRHAISHNSFRSRCACAIVRGNTSYLGRTGFTEKD